MEDKKEEVKKETENVEKLLIIPSKNTHKGDKWTLTVSEKSFPEGVTAEDLVAAVRVNGEKEKEKEKEEGTKNKRKFLPLLFVPVLLSVPLLLRGCQCTHDVPVEHRESFEIEISDVQNPGEQYWAAVGQAGQEMMTNEFVMGDNGIYDMNQQAYYEDKATETYSSYENTTGIIEEAIEVLEDVEASNEDISKALQTLETQYGIRVEIREDAEAGIEENAERFNNAAELHTDERTEVEEAIMENIVNDFYEDNKLDAESLEEIQAVNEAVENGARLENVEITQDKDGDYVITGDQVTELVEQQTHKGLKAAWHKLGEWMKGIKQNILGNSSNSKGEDR